MFALLKAARFVLAATVFAMIATGNGDAVLSASRTAMTTVEQTLSSLQALGQQNGSSAQKAVGSQAKPAEQFEFTMHDGGKPVLWCSSTIDLLINDTYAPKGARADFLAAAAKISATSGINLRVIGDTDLIADRNSHLRAGNPYPAVLVGWATTDMSDLLIPGASAVAVANPARTERGMELVTGAMVFNTHHDVLYRSGFGKGMTRGNLYLHELSHLLGLGHVEGNNKLMDATIGNDTASGLAAGDKAGLRAAGACR